MKSNLICGRGPSGGSYIVQMLHTNVDEIGSQNDHRPIFFRGRNGPSVGKSGKE